MKVLYQVTEPEDRARLQATIDGTINQYATIGAGVVLLILSVIFHSEDILVFLRAVSFVYLFIFAAWAWLSFLLFGMYKVKIREYLRGLAKRKSKSGPAAEIIEAEKVKDEVYDHILRDAVGFAGGVDRQNIEEYILYYNPPLRNVSAGRELLPHLKRAYYNNENFFSRLLIIWHMEHEGAGERLKFVKEYYGISELQLRLQMLAMLTAGDFKLPPEDAFFFTGLCQDTAAELMWAYASRNDLEGQVQQSLIDALHDHVRALQNLMFALLKVLYEKKYIESVREIFNSKDRSEENLLFAVELLDSLLESQMKKMILPLFEHMPYSARKEKLQKILLVYELAPEMRLKEILMSNFMTVNPHVKQLALKEYYKLTSDISILRAHTASSVEDLHATARILLGNTDDHTFISKMKVADKMKLSHDIDPGLFAYFVKWGLFAASRKRKVTDGPESGHRQTFQFNSHFITTVHENGTKLSLDTLGLSLLFKANNQSIV